MYEDSEVTPHRAKKDRKKWCKGKVGRDHNYEWVVPQNAYRTCQKSGPFTLRTTGEVRGPWWSCFHMMVCSKCGRQDYYVGGNRQDCPDRPSHLAPLPNRWWL